MRAILVHAADGPAAENRLQTGLDIARRFNGHVTAHVNTPVAHLVATDPFGGAYPLTEVIERERAIADALVARLTDRLSREDVPFTVENSEAEPVEAISMAARLADLAIVDLDDGASMGRPNASFVGSLATSGRTPVLALVPTRPVPLDGTVMIAWNDSRESAAAVRAALPLLACAKAVRVVRVGRAEDGMKATPVLEYLSRHDVHAALYSVEPGLLTIEEVIEREAESLGADLIVMGAYGHSRMRELLFGGVTRYLLESGRFPLFMAH